MTFADHSPSATLLLLLAISMLIVGRSVFIRRRARRTMEQAMRNGTLPPQTARPIVKLGAKPKLFDVYSTGHRISGGPPLDDGSLTWANIKVLPHLQVNSDQSVFTGLVQYHPASLRHIEETSESTPPSPTTTITYSNRSLFIAPAAPCSPTAPIVTTRCPRITFATLPP